MKSTIVLIIACFTVLVSCSLLSYSRQQHMERCILEMVARDVPADIAEEKCRNIYGNVHTDYRKEIPGDRQRK